MTELTPKGMRPHIVLIGNRNVGKSSLINALTDQKLSIVSDVPGTTTDPVEKAFELQPYGPVVLIDTAGMDDVGELGAQRIERTNQRLNQADLVLLIKQDDMFSEQENVLIQTLKQRAVPIIIVRNKCDMFDKKYMDSQIIPISCKTGMGIDMLKDKLVSTLQSLAKDPLLVADLVTPPAVVVLVVPIDKEAPQGRLILPQVQVLRELLDHDITAIVVKEQELSYALNYQLKEIPKLVITDSQVFMKVNADTPISIPLTSFSILLARSKGDLRAYVDGVMTIPLLQDGDKILIAELCAHRPITEDIGRVKIPRWLSQYTGKNLQFDVQAGKDIPEDLSSYKLIIQCGGCMVNRALILSRIRQAQSQNVAITNYGITIAYLHGILPRALQLFPDVSSQELLKGTINTVPGVR